ncbi:MAG: type II toxin-antitoxin system VapC family toxin, partial [Gemmatimonadetes bacterium]|nr:type II toxin-antitoxin system VapC family toxin [Gemmatimonadota bacterium]
RRTALALLDTFDGSPLVEVTPLSEELYERGHAFFRRHRDKSWGLTDCISFVVMRERGLTDVLTADRHFRQAGFRPLLG